MPLWPEELPSPAPARTTGPGEPRYVLLAFLTTTCAPCERLWRALPASRYVSQGDVDLVIVTPSPNMEDEATARLLAPPSAKLHMASETWFSYGVGRAGTIMLVAAAAGGPPAWEGGGEVLGGATLDEPDDLDGLLHRWLGREDGPDLLGTAPH